MRMAPPTSGAGKAMISESGESSGVHIKTAPARFLDRGGGSIGTVSSVCGNGGNTTIFTGTATDAAPGTLHLTAGNRGDAARRDVNAVRRRLGTVPLVPQRRR